MRTLPTRCLNLIVLLALSATCLPQLRAGTRLEPTQGQTKEAAIAKINQLLQQSGYTFHKAADNVWVVNRKGANIGAFDVLVAVETHYVLMGVVVAKKDRMRMTGDLTFKLLRLAHSTDYVKVGLDNDEDLFVRIEVRLRLFDLQSLKDMIEDVSTASDKAYLGVKPFLK
ncbi:MAG TPA: hypothetical protein VHE60_12275 [Pyrinomonadaceae bacterium]|nr:hypothetical protein [Pyrinomonadaceae bacterium]